MAGEDTNSKSETSEATAATSTNPKGESPEAGAGASEKTQTTDEQKGSKSEEQTEAKAKEKTDVEGEGKGKGEGGGKEKGESESEEKGSVTHGDYDLTYPEALGDIDAKFDGEYRSWIKELVGDDVKAQSAAATKGAKMLTDALAEQTAAGEKAFKATITEWEGALKELHGDRYDQALAGVNKVVADFGTADTKKVLDEAGFIYHPQVFAMLHKISQVRANPTPPNTTTGGRARPSALFSYKSTD